MKASGYKFSYKVSLKKNFLSVGLTKVVGVSTFVLSDK